MERWQWIASRFTRRIWFRATIISLFSIILVLAASWLAPIIPYDLSLKIGADAADNILGILASSMLAVTTFSMAAMVTAFGGAAQNVTPRAAQLLTEDRTAQNALSTFLGGFLFGVVGIAALSTGFYGPEGRAVLFVGTVLMIGLIVITLLRWIQQLTSFGRMEDAIRRVEEAALGAIERHDGPIRLSGRSTQIAPDGWVAIKGSAIGRVTHVDLGDIKTECAKADADLRIAAAPGEFVDSVSALAWVSRAVPEDCAAAIAAGFTVEANRQFEHDPRFGMVVLSEIASRALSPAVNDPGSAIAALAAGQRVAQAVISRSRSTADADPDALSPPLSLEEMIEDLILPVARDGAGLAEVGIRLQSMLGWLALEVPAAHPMLHRLAQDALGRSESARPAPFDLERVERAHRRAFPKND